MGETVKHRAVYKTVKIRLDTHIFLFYLPKTKKKPRSPCGSDVRPYAAHACISTISTSYRRGISGSFFLSRSQYLESEESFKKNEFDSKHPFIARN